jgi:hypothetical protein
LLNCFWMWWLFTIQSLNSFINWRHRCSDSIGLFILHHSAWWCLFLNLYRCDSCHYYYSVVIISAASGLCKHLSLVMIVDCWLCYYCDCAIIVICTNLFITLQHRSIDSIGCLLAFVGFPRFVGDAHLNFRHCDCHPAVIIITTFGTHIFSLWLLLIVLRGDFSCDCDCDFIS